jgi:S-DNA-T family DNA segregation ATPase FtsK/SpoIIIE
LYKHSPDELKFILIDPKRVEFICYEGLPHMLLEKAITEPEAAIQSLSWAHQEYERRYKIFEQLRVRNIREYKQKTEASEEYERLPYIVIIIDEVADLMFDSLHRKQVEDRVKALSAKARAAGLHLVLATQRPSVDVITGTIKANLPSRIAFSVTSFIDSKTILDTGGAEKLLGRGDMLFSANNCEPFRVQGAFVSGQEVEAVVSYVTNHNVCEFDADVKNSIYEVKETAAAKDAEAMEREDGERTDPLLLKVLKYFIESQKASISIVQRKFSVGFNRAANMVDQLELLGYIGASDGLSKQREIRITMPEFLDRFGDVDVG